MSSLASGALEKANSIDKLDARIKQFQSLIEPCLGVSSKQKPNVNGIQQFIVFVVEQIGENNTATSKPLLLFLAKRLESIEEDFNDQLLEVCKLFIERVRPKYTYYAQSLLLVCKLLAELYQADEDWTNAGRVMASIDPDDQHFWDDNTFDIAKRCEWRIETAEFFLQNEDNTSATKHIQKCRKLMRDIPLSKAKVKQQLGLRYKSCYSRILDSERKFLAAAVNYLEIAQIDTNLFDATEVNPADLLKSLENAVTCAILAPAGGPRTRVLAMLHRDERSRNLKNNKVLEKMHKNMILSNKDQEDFSKQLADHHQATLAGGLTVLQKAVYEHNMLAAAQLYKNIRIEELAKLLGVTLVQAEDLARIMIQENRLHATIDQVDGVIEFDNDSSILNSWDANISESLQSVNDIVDMVEAKSSLKFSI
mmetsp:Transcript_39209/g.64157  ORF Transcript_39209/g.64157 Transcript_39209/m.64157 type:complete len:423 (-) Transcript_39209:141-1409(-)|eukprot:CAMPEP_0202724876 /NCGR_PEP_ID=MMETSP1385-20130828/177298_1 /ASSEMBLY_ACC=CAM_ASM_000861 /TAXON_ID=933848 /ORGANISM="Elphidium margaritaceum" /LENGTH=422 /DNA_ID=CAMNT_0049390653 /DNA_START=21 /DNA_END=1289 /DNA_ORIENTATION=+